MKRVPPSIGDVLHGPERMVVFVDHNARTFGTKAMPDKLACYSAAPIEEGWRELNEGDEELADTLPGLFPEKRVTDE